MQANKNPVIEIFDLNNGVIDEKRVSRSFKIIVWSATSTHPLLQVFINPPEEKDSKVGRELHDYLTKTVFLRLMTILLSVTSDEKSREHCFQALLDLVAEKFDVKTISFTLYKESCAYVEEIDWLYMAKRQSRNFYFTEINEKGDTVIRFINYEREDVVATIPKPVA